MIIMERLFSKVTRKCLNCSFENDGNLTNSSIFKLPKPEIKPETPAEYFLKNLLANDFFFNGSYSRRRLQKISIVLIIKLLGKPEQLMKIRMHGL